MTTLVFATNNAHKLAEARSILGDDFHVLSLADIGCTADVDENADTLEGNSLLKAEYVFRHYGCDCFADDTGLEVRALGGAPGVHTARYASDIPDPAANRQKLLRQLSGCSDRSAQFRTAVTLFLGGHKYSCNGIVKGTIATQEKGDGGFGYDPLFIPDGYELTFAQLPTQIKNTISHRANALHNMKEIIDSIHKKL